jgi:hypothetical protein
MEHKVNYLTVRIFSQKSYGTVEMERIKKPYNTAYTQWRVKCLN